MAAAIAAPRISLSDATPPVSPTARSIGTSSNSPDNHRTLATESPLIVITPDRILPQEQELTGPGRMVRMLEQKAFVAGVWGAAATIGEIALSALTAIGGTLFATAAGLLWPKAGELLLTATGKILSGTIAIMPYTALTGAALIGSWLVLHKLDELLSGPKEL